MNKIPTEYLKYFWPMRHFLITCGREERANIIPVSFCMPVSKNPPMVACAIGKTAHSSEIIRKTHEFVVNVPGQELNRQVYYCGFHSGRDVDKFKETGLTPLPAHHVDSWIIAECPAHMECRVEHCIETGDKYIFVAVVLEAYADEWLEKGERALEYAIGEFPEKVYGGRFER
ncbi:flavin reductase family protein [bacterium]|nr:flavin reductase family protein [candidate division CSSED10-310 bacterium]